MEELVATLRALVISRKEASTLDDILRDYVEFEGKPVEVKKFGFKKVEDLLVASGEFKLASKQGETIVIPRVIKATAHIAKMVQKQKSKPPKSKPQKFVAKKKMVMAKKSPRKNTLMKPAKLLKRKRRESFSGCSYSESSCGSFRSSLNPPSPPPWQRQYPVSRRCGFTPLQESMPDSTFSSFHRSFPESIDNYSDLEVAVALEVYASFSGVSPPVYNVYTIPGCRGYFCSVRVDRFQCSTEPSFYESPLKAKIECAYVALQTIHASCMLLLYPVYDGDSRLLAKMIAEELRMNGGGALCHMVPSLFRSRYNESLPKNWLGMIKPFSRFSMRVSEVGDVLVLNEWC